MKITHLAAAVAMIAVCGLAHADEGPPPPPPQAYGQPGYGPQGPGPYAPVEEGYDQEIVRRRTTIVPGVPIGAPPNAGPAVIVPAALPFPPAVSAGCGILQSRVRPDLFRVIVMWRNGAHGFDTGVVGPRGVDYRIGELRSLGYCLNDEHQPIFKIF